MAYSSSVYFSLLLLALCPFVIQAARVQEQLLTRVARSAPKHPFRSPTGLFIQERASKQLPGPGQHFSFGAIVGWDQIHRVLDSDPESRLLFLIRHGEAYSNWLSNTLGPDEWFKIETTCAYKDTKSNLSYGLFDAGLTDLGRSEARALSVMLKEGGWYNTLASNRTTRAIVSPLTRCLKTAIHTLYDLPIPRIDIEESIRETLGEDTCDARRSVSDLKRGGHSGPCVFKRGLENKFTMFNFPIARPTVFDDDDEFGRRASMLVEEAAAAKGEGVSSSFEDADEDNDDSEDDEEDGGTEDVRDDDLGKSHSPSRSGGDNDDSPPSPEAPSKKKAKNKKKNKHHGGGDDYDSDSGTSEFGMISDADLLWTTTRETQKEQVYRATHFLNKLYRFADEKVIFVVTHSGFTRSLLLAVGREPYRPQNTELVPVIVQRRLI